MEWLVEWGLWAFCRDDGWIGGCLDAWLLGGSASKYILLICFHAIWLYYIEVFRNGFSA